MGMFVKERVKRQDLKASYTVETAVVMGMVLLVIVVGIYSGFYWYDRVMVYAEGYYYGIECMQKETVHSGIPEKIRGQFLGCRNRKVKIADSADKVIIEISAVMKMPYLFREMNIRQTAEVKVLNRVAYIRKIRNLKTLIGEGK